MSLRNIRQFPHCDQRVLHTPGQCHYCDMHPEWQELREAWGINFTGGTLTVDEYGAKYLPCPSEVNRPLATINKWHGNIPVSREAFEAQVESIDDTEILDMQTGVLEEEKPSPAAVEAPETSVGTGPLYGAKTTLSGRPADLEYYVKNGGAPQPIDPATGMHQDYWVLNQEERSKGYVRPLRRSYVHESCGGTTTMGHLLAETYACKPSFYSHTFCAHCRTHPPVGEFYWLEDGRKGPKVGS